MSRTTIGIAILACLATGIAVMLATAAYTTSAAEPNVAPGTIALADALSPSSSRNSNTTPASSTQVLTTDAGTPILFCSVHAAAATMPEMDIYTLPESIQREGEWRARYFCPADFNKDDQIDSDDLALFLAVFSAQDGPMAPWLDIDADGDVTPMDLEQFLNVFERNDCDPAKNAEHRLMVC